MSQTRSGLSQATRRNWWIDAAVFIGAVLSILTGIYFLYLPIGGYQGGRNLTYGITILFDRHTWEDIHIWGGIGMIAAVVIHLWIHWAWITMMTRKITTSLRSRGATLSKGARVNVIVDATIAIGFLLTAVSGLYFFFEPASGVFIFTSPTWDVIHTWAAIALTLAAITHLYIHWLWVAKVTAKMFRRQPAPAPALPSPLESTPA